MRFLVGDKVRIVGSSNACKHYFDIGTIGTIEEIDLKERTYDVSGTCGFSQWVCEQDMEHVMPEKEKQHDQKVYEVYDELQRHVGEENAISATRLCLLCGVDGHRGLRKIMRKIRRSTELEKIPCSCNKGYYMASTKEEAIKSINRILNTAKNEFKTGYIIMKKLGLDKQMKIPLGEYFKDTYHSLMEIDDETNTETD